MGSEFEIKGGTNYDFSFFQPSNADLLGTNSSLIPAEATTQTPQLLGSSENLNAQSFLDIGRYNRQRLENFNFTNANSQLSTAPKTYPKPEVSNRYTANTGTYGSRGGTDIDAIVLHHTGGSNASGAASTLNQRGLSAHYLIDKDGTIYQMLGDEKRAFHAGGGSIRGDGKGVNSRSIGIEIVNRGNGTDKYTEAQYAALEKLIPHLTNKYQIPTKNIVGHSQIGNPNRPASSPEPSANFDWQRIQRAATGGNNPPTNNDTQRMLAPTSILRRRSNNNDVKKLQDAMVELGYLRRSEIGRGYGNFGPRTERAVRAFQRDHRDLSGRQLVDDGIYGARTRGALQKALDKKAADTPQTNPPPTINPPNTNPPNTNPPNSNAPLNIDNIVGVRNNRNVTPEFRREVAAMAQRLGTRPEYLMAVMSFETGGSFSPSKVNNVSGATGLIQFLPGTARDFGTTTAELSRMTSVEQLRYVERYMAQDKFDGKLNTLEGVYTAVLSGRARNNGSDVLFAGGTSAYRQNSGLDFNRNGQITAGEATSAVAFRLFGGVERVQQKLKDVGFDPGTVDGKFGGNTSRAIAAFQRANNLNATGLLDERTGRALFSARNVTAPPTENGNNNNQIPSGRPSEGRITSRFGPRVAPKPGASTNHRGIDFGAPFGARVQSTAPGRVEFAGNSGDGAGNMVIINHGGGYKTYYFHLSEINVSVGQQVSDSQKIGEVGETGTATAPHLHYEVRRNGVAVNPEPFL